MQNGEEMELQLGEEPQGGTSTAPHLLEAEEQPPAAGTNPPSTTTGEEMEFDLAGTRPDQGGPSTAPPPALQLQLLNLLIREGGVNLQEAVDWVKEQQRQRQLLNLLIREGGVNLQEPVDWVKEQQRQRQRDSLEAIQALAGVVAQVTFMHTTAGHNAGSFVWVCNAIAFTLSITVAMVVMGERMLLPAGAASAAPRPAGTLLREIAAITMALSLAFTLLTFAAAQLSGEELTLALLLEARILLPLGAPLLLFTVLFLSFLLSRMSNILPSNESLSRSLFGQQSSSE